MRTASAAALTPLLVAAWTTGGWAGEKPGCLADLGFRPAETKVVLLPAVVEPDVKLPLDLSQKYCRRAARGPFWRHGFMVLDEAATRAAITELNIDLADPNQWTKHSYAAIGDKLGARLVVAFRIVSARKCGKTAVWENVNMSATVEMRLYDCLQKAYPFDGYLTGMKLDKGGPGLLPGIITNLELNGEQTREIKAAALGVRAGCQKVTAGLPTVNEGEPPDEAAPVPAEGAAATTPAPAEKPAGGQ